MGLVMNEFSLGKITHISIVVSDIEKAVNAWARFLGSKKPNIILAIQKIDYEGNVSEDYVAKFAFFKVGDLTIELVEPKRGLPSSWSDFLLKHGTGIHHIAFIVEDLDKCIEKIKEVGGRVEQLAEFIEGKYAYVDARESLGLIVECIKLEKPLAI